MFLFYHIHPYYTICAGMYGPAPNNGPAIATTNAGCWFLDVPSISKQQKGSISKGSRTSVLFQRSLFLAQSHYDRPKNLAGRVSPIPGKPPSIPINHDGWLDMIGWWMRVVLSLSLFPISLSQVLGAQVSSISVHSWALDQLAGWPNHPPRSKATGVAKRNVTECR